MRKTKLQILLSLCLTIVLHGQDAFKVIASRGNATTKDGKKALIGMKISQTDAIKLNPNDYLGLIHITTGKTLELKTAGSYYVKDLSAKVSGTTSSYSQKYAEYVMNAMSQNGGSANNAVGGVVYRATYDVALDYPANEQKVMITDRVFDIHWHKHKKISTYEIVVQNMFDEVIFKTETKDTIAKVDLSKVEIGDENRIKLKVKAKNESERVYPQDKEVNILLNESKDFMKRKEEFLSEVKEESALNNLIKAKFFESNDMYIDALKAYDKAISLEPSVSEFKKMKLDYMNSVGALSNDDDKK